MKRVVSIAAFAAVLAGGVAIAQQPPAPPSPDQRHDQHMPGGMCPMMSGGMMGGGMMPGGMTGGQSYPRMMQMRGEMMKAMGDIRMKYGTMMETPGR